MISAQRQKSKGDEAIARAIQEPTLTKALAWIAIWDAERAIAQAREFDRTGVSTAAHGNWDFCFEYFFKQVQAAWMFRTK